MGPGRVAVLNVRIQSMDSVLFDSSYLGRLVLAEIKSIDLWITVPWRLQEFQGNNDLSAP